MLAPDSHFSFYVLQSACATPIRTAGGDGSSLVSPAQVMELLVPSPDQLASPRQQFPPADPKSIACLQAAFGQDFVAEHLVHKMIKVRGRPFSELLLSPEAALPGGPAHLGAFSCGYT